MSPKFQNPFFPIIVVFSFHVINAFYKNKPMLVLQCKYIRKKISACALPTYCIKWPLQQGHQSHNSVSCYSSVQVGTVLFLLHFNVLLDDIEPWQRPEEKILIFLGKIIPKQITISKISQFVHYFHESFYFKTQNTKHAFKHSKTSYMLILAFLYLRLIIVTQQFCFMEAETYDVACNWDTNKSLDPWLMDIPTCRLVIHTHVRVHTF